MYTNYYFLGIGGIGMSAIARYFKFKGCSVGGYDRVRSMLVGELEAEGIQVVYKTDVSSIPETFLDKAQTLIIRTPAIPDDHEQLCYFRENGFQIKKRAEVLGDITRQGKSLCVAGTHGKTTTSSLLTWILEACGKNPGFLIGGVPANFGHSARLTDSRYFVIEADEYDTCFFDKRSKFLHYRPKTAILNNLEYDHADIFPDLGAIETQFHHLVRTMAQNARVVVNGECEALHRVLARGLYSECVYFNNVQGWHIEGRELFYKERLIGELHLSLPGHHNLLNASAAIAAATHIGIDPCEAVAALNNFVGVKRRMEVKGTVRGITVIDDFAHHPTAIFETIAALRSRMAQGKIIAVLEPRSNTMKMGTMKDRLPESLQGADQVVCYANPNLGWDVQAALAPLGEKLHVLHTIDETAQVAASLARNGDAIIVMSNGGFGGIHGKLLDLLRKDA